MSCTGCTLCRHESSSAVLRPCSMRCSMQPRSPASAALESTRTKPSRWNSTSPSAASETPPLTRSTTSSKEQLGVSSPSSVPEMRTARGNGQGVAANGRSCVGRHARAPACALRAFRPGPPFKLIYRPRAPPRECIHAHAHVVTGAAHPRAAASMASWRGR